MSLTAECNPGLGGQELAGKQVTCITAGSPRVGDYSFADEYFKLMRDPHVLTCYRVVHNCDVVPSVPLQIWGYRHVGKPIWLRKMHNNWSFVYLTITDTVAPRGNEINSEVTSRPTGYGAWVSAPLRCACLRVRSQMADLEQTLRARAAREGSASFCDCVGNAFLPYLRGASRPFDWRMTNFLFSCARPCTLRGLCRLVQLLAGKGGNEGQRGCCRLWTTSSGITARPWGRRWPRRCHPRCATFFERRAA